MFKKILSLALALMMIMSVAAVAASAAQVEIVDEAADASSIAEQGAENDDAATGALDTSKCFNFEVAGTGWNDFGAIGFYVFEIGGSELIPWGSKKLFRSEETSSGVWSYDPEANGMTIESGKQYAILFVNQNSSAQTYNLIFDSSCIGDTAYCTGNALENDVDSNKTSLECKWRNSSYGPQKLITSIGNVVGETIPANTTPYEMFVSFLKEKLENARTYSGKDDQTLLDDTAKALGIGKSDVEKAIGEAGVTAEWSKDKSTLADESDASANQSGSSNSGNTNNNSSNSNNNSNSNSSSNTKSGSASNTQTGQSETILFISLALMVAAAGVIFFARKRERA